MAAPLPSPGLPQPDWLQTTLCITGPADTLAAFRAAAAGAGVVPWAMDYDRLEEDWFYLLMAPPPSRRAISAAGARILARRLREAAWARHEEALSRVATCRCPPISSASATTTRGPSPGCGNTGAPPGHCAGWKPCPTQRPSGCASGAPTGPPGPPLPTSAATGHTCTWWPGRRIEARK